MEPEELELPPFWVPVPSEDGSRVYWYNTKSRASRWEKPRKQDTELKQIKASHILIKHRGVRNPVSKGANPGEISRDFDEALVLANEILDQLHQSENPQLLFGQIALERSDCNSYIRNGDLGKNTRQKWQKDFADAAFELDVHEISGVISSQSGLHVVMRTE
ncbi:hypothetical protein BASA81_003402 [Batrachochytrium salamandrivorans]|nr:hypothetical protein BASA81_003402 [Batrachochytrium salamandrivorans]